MRAPRGDGGGVDSGLVGLHLKNTLVSVYYLQEVPWEEQGPKCQNIRIKDMVKADAAEPEDRTERGPVWPGHGWRHLHGQVGRLAESEGAH